MDSVIGGPTIPFHCPMCATDFGKSQRELNLYGILVECPNCHGSFDGKDQLKKYHGDTEDA